MYSYNLLKEVFKLDNNERVLLIADNNSMWVIIKKNMSKIGSFLRDPQKSSDKVGFFIIAYRLVLSELVLNSEGYNKYCAKEYSEEDFVDMVIESIALKIPEIEDTEGNEKYIEEIRNITWGHIKSRILRFSDMLSFGDVETMKKEFTPEDMDVFMECLTVIWVECVLRLRETQILEHNYGE